LAFVLSSPNINMSSSVVPSDPSSQNATGQMIWSLRLAAVPRGLSLAREAGWMLVWDAGNVLYLVNRAGQLQGRTTAAGPLSAACAADDGSACACASERGEMWRLTPDLMPRWSSRLPNGAVACALDPFGRKLAVADASCGLHFFDLNGKVVGHTQTPRPCVHLAFIPEEPLLIGCADFGFIGCFELSGNCVWRDGLVANVGGMGVNGDGSRIVLACYTDGLRSYSLDGRQHAAIPLAEPCRQVALSYDGKRALVAGLSSRVFVVDREGQTVSTHDLDASPVAVGMTALGDVFFAALADGRLTAVQLR
jgi:hypothetical protein